MKNLRNSEKGKHIKKRVTLLRSISNEQDCSYQGEILNIPTAFSKAEES